MNSPSFSNKAEAFEASDDTPTHIVDTATIGDVIQHRFGRRDVLKGALAVTTVSYLMGGAALPASATTENTSSAFDFNELQAGIDGNHHLAEGYEADILLRWGDGLFEDSEAFDPRSQTAARQHRQFGYNNDYIGIFKIADRPDNLLMCVNHEYTNPEVMFPGLTASPKDNDFSEINAQLVEVEMAAHGVSIVELEQRDGKWRAVPASAFNRRISASNTEMSADGPAAGHRRLQTSADPSGKRIVGTLNNCAGGVTPWGTYLTAEENFHGYFWTDEMVDKDDKQVRRKKGLGDDQADSYARYGLPGNWYNWGAHQSRFNVDKEPNEANRFGWVVEIDPFDPSSTPVKHTALGRFAHEGCECIVNADGRTVVYSGDDARFEYVYRFISANQISADREANMALLSEGTLSVARFNANGTVDWLPLVYGNGPLVPQNGWESQAQVLIDARLAAKALGATPMDRPEDVQPNEQTGKVYVMLTNNNKRKKDQIDNANPRADNLFGHIIEMTTPGGDHSADQFTWQILIKCGDPMVADVGSLWNPATSADGWFGSPDNCTIDNQGRLWVATDQGKNWPKTGKADGLYAVDTEGAARGTAKLFFRVPVGAEMCGPCFTPDFETVFLPVQHPGTDGTKEFEGFERESTFEDPATRWPDFSNDMPPRPSIVATRKKAGGRIGG
ncbi:alkaline phosphatase PhoX [Anderseniella sp. Alg231-50]|uniref:alkaline phosphatase PhoX n=1 Tax=Anderseniella sp. Alg231-50 TaxID=1922226 RepID=UPI000D54B460